MREKNVARAICPPDEAPVTGHQSPGERILRCAQHDRLVAAHSVRHMFTFVLLLTILLWCACSIRAITKSQSMQYEAERWQGPTEQRFCQVAVWLNGGELNAAQAAGLEAEMKRSFPEQEAEAPIVTAYGTWETGSAAYGRRKTTTELWRVSEGFFLLHSVSMASGGTGSFARNGDEAVLNEAAAFALFGSFDCVGECIRIGPLGWRVIAVVREPAGSLNKAAFAGTPRIWLPIRESSDLSFYEAILPEYYDGFAAQTLERTIGAAATSSTGRFRLPQLWREAKLFFQIPPSGQPDLPPWEQAARLAQRRLCLLWSLLVLALLSSVLRLLLPAKSGRRLSRPHKKTRPPE